MRLLPEVFKFFNDKNDREHEYRMTELQLQIDKARSEQSIDLVHAQGTAAEQLQAMTAYTEALKSQAVVTGNWIVDGLNMLVRPVVTYWWLFLYSVFKVFTIAGAWEHFTTPEAFAVVVWTSDDWGILSMLLSFWFVGRVFDSSHKK